MMFDDGWWWWWWWCNLTPWINNEFANSRLTKCLNSPVILMLIIMCTTGSHLCVWSKHYGGDNKMERGGVRREKKHLNAKKRYWVSGVHRGEGSHKRQRGNKSYAAPNFSVKYNNSKSISVALIRWFVVLCIFGAICSGKTGGGGGGTRAMSDDKEMGKSQW